MTRNWNEDRSRKRIKTRLDEVKNVTVKDYVRDTSLTDIPTGTAYRVNGVHIYIDITNFEDILNTTEKDGITAHRRALRFLNQHYRAVHRILKDEGVVRVDFANQRLHAVVIKPYDDEAARVHKAVAVSQLIADVVARGSEIDDTIPNATVRVGIDTGKALAVNNGRRGDREPLFLGRPANMAAKYAAGKTTGLYLTAEARKAISLPEIDYPKSTKLTNEQIKTSQDKAKLSSSADKIVEEWKKEQEETPLAEFTFTKHTPPFENLDFETLSASKSKRQEAISVFADIDGFTKFVDRHINDDDTAKDVVRVLHVLRSELDAVLNLDFKGRKARFIGDCIHGLLVEGTAATTDAEETVRVSTLCSGGLRSGFNLAIEILDDEEIDVAGLGLAIGFEYGWISMTRLGVKGSLIRAAIGRGVLASEQRQKDCKDGTYTCIGDEAYNEGSDEVRDLFGTEKTSKDLTYAKADNALKKKSTAKSEASNSLLGAASGLAAAPAHGFPPRPASPNKPAGFA